MILPSGSNRTASETLGRTLAGGTASDLKWQNGNML